MRISRTLATIAASTLLATSLVACSNESDDTAGQNTDGDGNVTVKIGTTDADQKAWSVFSDLAADEGIDLDIVQFSDYAPVNEALALFWKDHDSLDGIEGEEVAIPNDDTNQGRAINVLVQAGLLELKDGADEYAPAPVDVDTEASKVSVVPVDASQTPSAYGEGRPAIINNSWLDRAGIEPSEAIFQDDPGSEQGEPYINVFASRAEDVDNPTYVKLAELWHDAAVSEAVQKDSRGTAVEVERPADELNDILDRLEQNEK